MTKTKDMQMTENHVENTERTEQIPVNEPATDIYEKDDAILLHLDMPGVSEQEVEVELDNHTFSITGRRTVKDEEGLQALHRGFGDVHYKRVFTLGREIDRDGITARMKHGVLAITLPKTRKASDRRRSIEIKAG